MNIGDPIHKKLIQDFIRRNKQEKFPIYTKYGISGYIQCLYCFDAVRKREEWIYGGYLAKHDISFNMHVNCYNKALSNQSFQIDRKGTEQPCVK